MEIEILTFCARLSPVLESFLSFFRFYVMFSVSTFLIENQLDVSDRLITSNDKIRKRRRKLRTLLPMTALLSSRGCRKEVSG